MPSAATSVRALVSGELYLQGLPRESVRDAISDLTLPNPVYQQTKKFGSPYALKTIPKTLSYYREPKPGTLVVPRGYAPTLKINFEKVKISVFCPKVKFPPFQITPRKNQTNIINDWSENKGLPWFDGVACMPPGEGKSIAGLLVAGTRGVRTIVVSHRDSILLGWERDLKKVFGPDIKYKIWKGKKSVRLDDDTQIVLASIQTLAQQDVSVWYDKFGLLIVDECHRVPAQTTYDLVENCAARYRLGLTATPKRDDGLEGLIHFACGPIFSKQAKSGNTLPVEVLRVKTPFTTSAEKEDPFSFRIHTLYKRQIDNPKRVRALIDLCTFIRSNPKLSKPVLILCAHKEGGKILAEEIRKAKIGTVSQCVSLTRKQKAQFIEDVRDNKIFFTVATPSMLGEGVDVPNWTHVILFNGFTKKTQVRQVGGRVERPYEGKEKGFVWDLVDDCPRIEHQYRHREEAYRESGFSIRYMRLFKKNGTWVLRERKKNA